MNRFLLTLLALLTGIVAPVASASAAIRTEGEAEISTLQTAKIAARLAARSAVRVQNHPEASATTTYDVVAFVDTRVVVPTTLIGIDRARE